MDNTITDEYKKKISNILNEYIMDEKWDEAEKILKDELEKTPEDHWLITQLSEIYYEKKDYETALKLSSKAIKLAPNCPLAINDYALHLYMHEKDDLAIENWNKLLQKGVKKIAYGECGEGIQQAKSMLNDVRMRMALSYSETGQKDKASFYYNEHLNNRQRGLFSNFKKKEVEKELLNLGYPLKVGQQII